MTAGPIQAARVAEMQYLGSVDELRDLPTPCVVILLPNAPGDGEAPPQTERLEESFEKRSSLTRHFECSFSACRSFNTLPAPHPIQKLAGPGHVRRRPPQTRRTDWQGKALTDSS